MYALHLILLNAVVERIRGVNKRKALKKDFILLPSLGYLGDLCVFGYVYLGD